MASPIAADGGFGQMESEESEESEEDADAKIDVPEPDLEKPVSVDDGLGDEFDDFEAGALDEDFGDFDDGEESERIEPEVPSTHSLLALESPFVSRFNPYTVLSYVSYRCPFCISKR